VFTVRTDTSPLTALAPEVMAKLGFVVVCGDAGVQPVGYVQRYSTAPGTAVRLKVKAPLTPAHTVVAPEALRVPGSVGLSLLTVTGYVCAVLLPQALLAVTVMLPLMALPSGVAVKVNPSLLTLDVQPVGTLHV
jgi:hypothetical protein